MDLLSFIQTIDPTKVRVGERQRAKGKPKLLDTTVGRVVPLLPVALAHASSELEASVDKLFDEGGSGGQAKQDASPVQPKCQRKWKIIVSDAGGPSHPPKKLMEDHETSTGPSVACKSRSALQRLIAGAVLNPKVEIAALPTLPFITSSVSVTPEREGANIAKAEVDSFARPSIPLMTVATTVTSTVDPAITVKEKIVKSSIFGGDSPSGWADHTVDDGCTCHEMVDEFAPPKFFASIRRIEHDQLFTEFNVGAARQMSLSAEVKMHAEYNIRERRRLNSIVEEKSSLLKAMDTKIESLKAQLLVKEAKAAKAIHLRVRVADLAASVKVKEQEVAYLDAQISFAKSQSDNLADRVHELGTSFAGLQEKITTYENFIDQLKKFQDEKMGEVNEKFDKICADFVEMALHLEEKFYPHLLTTIFGRRWLLTHDMELAITKCLNSTENFSTLGAAIGKAVEKEADYLSALQRLHSVIFSSIAELRSHKDANVDTIMNLLRLDDTLAERLGLTESQPHVN
ncbi:hypothetical protein Tco_1296751 [Tanacetum coccineum]